MPHLHAPYRLKQPLSTAIAAVVGGTLSLSALVAQEPSSRIERSRAESADSLAPREQSQRQPYRQSGQPARTDQRTNSNEHEDRTPARERRGQSSEQNPDRSWVDRDRERSQDDSAWIGVYLARDNQPRDNQPRDNQPSGARKNGALITQVYPASPAARAGLLPGDVISSVNGQTVANGSQLIDTLDRERPGSRVQLTVTRNNQPMEVPVVLGSRRSFAWNAWGDEGEARREYAFNRERETQSGQSESDDYWEHVPPFAMQLEHERRMYEQHQRIEEQLAKLQDEVRQLREAIQRR